MRFSRGKGITVDEAPATPKLLFHCRNFYGELFIPLQFLFPVKRAQ